MTVMRKVTAFLPADLVTAAQAETGASLTETLRIGLEKIRREAFYKRLRDLRGKVSFEDFDLDKLREDREFDSDGNVI